MAHEDLCFQTVAELSELIAAKKISSVELTRAYLERMDELNPKITVLVNLMRDRALQEAAAADREIGAGRVRGPLHGIPYGLKDLYDTKDFPTTGGSTIYRERRPARDAFVVDKLAQAGAVVMAKLAMSEFASGGNNNNLNPQPKNPWKLDRSPAGSSSGSGAATSAAVCAFTLGSETGGSIMGPCGANGVSGMRPTYGRCSRRGVMALAWSLDKCGPLTRSAEDVGLVLQAMAGHDPEDRSSRSTSAFTFRRDPGRAAGRKLGVVRPEFDAAPEANRAIFAQALDVLKRAGFVLEDVTLPDYPYAQVYSISSQTEAGTNFKPLYNDKRIDGFWSFDRRADWMAQSMMPAYDYIRAQRIRALIKRDADRITGQYAALLVPTNPRGSAPLGSGERMPEREGGSGGGGGGRGADGGGRASLNTMGNLAGLPSVSVPCGYDAEGMPLGLHIAARSWDEQSCLDVAMTFQKETDFHRKRPQFRA
jgi:aspartyl-tRNA(Asn)/glutamyl-tRNA(Gln) amidotransferase subunit A